MATPQIHPGKSMFWHGDMVSALKKYNRRRQTRIRVNIGRQMLLSIWNICQIWELSSNPSPNFWAIFVMNFHISLWTFEVLRKQMQKMIQASSNRNPMFISRNGSPILCHQESNLWISGRGTSRGERVVH